MTDIERIERNIADLTEFLRQSMIKNEEFNAAFKAQIAASQEEFDRRTAEADRRFAKADKESRQLKKRIDEIGKQLGGLGNKFGSFTEGLLLPSVEKILRKKFGITDFFMRLKTQRGKELQELDGFGFVNGKKNIGFVIEVKSHLDNRSIEQTLEQLRRFGKFHPQYKGMKIHGIIAAVDTVSESQRKAVYNAGLYLVTVHNDVARMPKPPQDFTPFVEIA